MPILSREIRPDERKSATGADADGDLLVLVVSGCAFDPPTGKAHFLKENDWKNCNYHLHVLELLSAILPRLSTSQRAGFMTTEPSLGMSVLAFLLKTYKIKFGEGLKKDSKSSPNGNFDSCGPREALTTEVLGKLDALVAGGA